MALVEEQTNKQQRFMKEMDKGYSDAKKLSDEELERKLKKAYKKDGKRDAKTLGMGRELVERKKES